MNIITKNGSTIRSVAISCLAIAALALFGSSAAFAQESANKTSAMIARGDIAFVSSAPVLIAEERVKTSKPTDLLLSVTAESSIITTVLTTGSETQSAEGKLEVYITIGDTVVPVAPSIPTSFNGNPPHGDTAAVVFANQAYRRTTMLGGDDENDTVETYLKTKHAAGFNWMAFNVGSGTHHIRVWAVYTENETTPETAEGVIGNRSLIVQPVKSAHRETITIN